MDMQILSSLTTFLVSFQVFEKVKGLILKYGISVRKNIMYSKIPQLYRLGAAMPYLLNKFFIRKKSLTQE